MRLTIVTTLYYSAPYVVPFFERMSAAAARVTDQWEILFVNDGSPDDAREQVLQLRTVHPQVALLDLTRNFGHHKAMMAGLRHASGDYVFLIDADLEEDPGHLLPLWKAMQATPDCDAVYGVQHRRKGDLSERLFGRLYYRLLRLSTGYRYPKNTLTARIMTARYVAALRLFGEKELDLWTLFLLNGFWQRGIPLPKGHKGHSTYTFRRKLRIAVDIVTSLSTLPLYAVALGGAVLLGTGMLYALYLASYRLMMGTVSHTAVIVAAIWLVGGLLLMSLGVICLYLGKMYLEIKARPLTITKELYPARHHEWNER